MADKSPRCFQDVILTLQDYWAEQGCAILQPYDEQVGAGTLHPATTLRALGPKPWRAAYVQPSRRPKDGRYGENPNRLQHYYQFQVILKPNPPDLQAALSAIARAHRHRSAAARHPLRRRRLGKPDRRRLGARLGSVVRRHGGVAVHVLPAGRRPRRAPGVAANSPTGSSGWRCTCSASTTCSTCRSTIRTVAVSADLWRRVPGKRAPAIALQFRTAAIRRWCCAGSTTRRRTAKRLLEAGAVLPAFDYTLKAVAPVQSARRARRGLAHGAAKLHRAGARAGEGVRQRMGGEAAVTPRDEAPIPLSPRGAGAGGEGRADAPAPDASARTRSAALSRDASPTRGRRFAQLGTAGRRSGGRRAPEGSRANELRARRLRKEMTPSEKELWKLLRTIEGAHFPQASRQSAITCTTSAGTAARLLIEIDGSVHRAARTCRSDDKAKTDSRRAQRLPAAAVREQRCLGSAAWVRRPGARAPSDGRASDRPTPQPRPARGRGASSACPSSCSNSSPRKFRRACRSARRRIWRGVWREAEGARGWSAKATAHVLYAAPAWAGRRRSAGEGRRRERGEEGPARRRAGSGGRRAF